MRALERYYPSDPSDIEEEHLCDKEIENLVRIGHITFEEGKKLKRKRNKAKKNKNEKKKKPRRNQDDRIPPATLLLSQLLSQQPERSENNGSLSQADFGGGDHNFKMNDGRHEEPGANNNFALSREDEEFVLTADIEHLVTPCEKQLERTAKLWSDMMPNLEKWYLASFSKGLPRLTLDISKIEQQDDCDTCAAHSHRHADITIISADAITPASIKFCDCKTLVHQLMMLHLFPATLSRPKTVFHFDLLDLMEDMKGEDELPVSAWQKMLDRRARRRDESGNVDQKLLNNTHLAYSRLLRNVEADNNAMT